MKVPRFGEIHWYFPFGDAEECTHCVIFNVREQTWYDNACPRSAGFYSQVFHYPVMADATANPQLQSLTLTGGAGTISTGDVIRGVTSGALGTVVYISGTVYLIANTGSGDTYIDGEGIEDVTSGATRTITLIKPLYAAHLHEKGYDAIIGDSVAAIESYFETADFGLPTGGAQPNQITGLNRWTRLVRVEPDFLQEGEMSVYVTGREFANAAETVSTAYNFDNTTGKVDMREQCREIRVKFVSNVVGGYYEMGRVILHTEPGDIRS